ncbi:hypothetical protein WI81_06270 [Burkholderia ubonensis]|nr:hypothetical protein WI81_06270 [Burkholderia ubonensis]
MESTLQGQLKAWRQHLHRYPETGLDEVKTSDFIATILTTLGLDVHRGIGGTGLVASLTVGNGDALGNGGVPLHNARYDFNDEILSIGARYFAELARFALPVA